jgi:hypothetical protein
MIKSWNANFLQEVPSVKSCSHLSAYAMQYVARVWTITSDTVLVQCIVQMQGSSEIIVVGEKVLIMVMMLELTDVGGVSFTSCSMMSSQT